MFVFNVLSLVSLFNHFYESISCSSAICNRNRINFWILMVQRVLQLMSNYRWTASSHVLERNKHSMSCEIWHERKERKREYWALTCGTSMLDIKQEFINKSLKHKNEERKILMRGNVKRNQQAVTIRLNPKSSYERILMAPTCRLIARFHFLLFHLCFFHLMSYLWFLCSTTFMNRFLSSTNSYTNQHKRSDVYVLILILIPKQ